MNRTDQSGLSRRSVLLATAGVAVAGTAAVLLRRPEPEPARPPGVPLSPFDSKSTAEDVTSGLDLAGRSYLITGVTSGIGLEAMRVLALRGARVIGTGRTLDRATAACASVTGTTVPLALELTDFPSIVAATDAVRALGIALDGVICNAGVMALPQLEQVNGLEKQFVTNHLGHFLLVNRLLDLVKAAPQGRVVVVSSSALKWADPAGIEWDNLSGERNYDPKRAYGQSKLANNLFSLELAKRFAGTPATSNSMNPGAVLTELQRHAPGWAVSAGKVVGPALMKMPAEGASTTCYLAAHPLVATVSGRYFVNCNPVALGGNTEDPAMAARLWDVSTELVRAWL
jgi:NAD(P)-dependent dehydrogenase (short-subunit alcohol dehydrogenase family)